MLILTRKPGESIYLGEDIKITILGLQGKQIKVGLDVPEDMTVYREEVYLRVKEQNRQALALADDDVYKVADLWRGKQSG